MSEIIPFYDWTEAGIVGHVNKAPKSKYQAIVIHHSAGRLTETQKQFSLEAFQAVEKAALGRKNKNGKPKFGAIPYNYLLHLPTGQVAEGRGTNYGDGGTRVTKSVKDGQKNIIKQGRTLSICVPGNYHPAAGGRKRPLDELEIKLLFKGISQVYEANKADLVHKWKLLRHRDLSATACPGDNLADAVDRINRILAFIGSV